ncbi:hypothetical protein GOP47_0010832 [Adiantum capillus-veneris]|uniref:Transcription repressor n=1 Tax=Adiantum capillus-veneris TaxID=13818 RepID=A0A9D4UVS4_ADICA|nr:hypothetical protein GOP47_0010832 [Adiantum capillus-veneris]
MEERSSSKPSKISSSKLFCQAHASIARSLSPFCARTVPLESTSSTVDAGSGWVALQRLIMAPGCMCSSTTSAVTEAQVPARGQRTDDVGCNNRHGAMRGDLKGKHSPSVSASKKQVMPKKGFTGHFNKGYARVSDVYLSTEGEAQMCHSLNTRVQGDKCHGKPDVHKAVDSPAAKFMGSYQPIVKYTCDPRKAFYESMMEMVLVGHRNGRDKLDLEDMFACFIVLNSSQHHLNIEEAFKLLLTELYSMPGFNSDLNLLLS